MSDWRVGVVAALTAEARHLGPLVRREGTFGVLADGTLVGVSGMGCKAAASTARALVASGARALASWGVAGGLDPALEPGTVFLADEVTSLDGARLATDARWRERSAAALTAHASVTGGTLLTSGHVLATRADKALAFARTGARAVDMESAAIAEIAHSAGCPFLCVRVIVDAAADTLPRTLLVAADEARDVSIARVLVGITRSPRDLPALLRLAGRFRRAGHALQAVARAGAITLGRP